MYSTHRSQQELNYQLLVGLKKHLLIAQDTKTKKAERVKSLENISEVLEYVLLHINDAISIDEQAIMTRFFDLLLIKTKKALVSIHTQPENFSEEISFLSVLLKI